MSDKCDFTNNSKYRAALEQGATFYFKVLIKDECGELADLTDFSAAMKVKTAVSSSVSVLSLSSPDCGIEINEDLGEVVVQVEHDVTANLTPGSYVYDLELTSPEDIVSRVIEGKIEITAEVTK
jgi:hypothetical protein